MVAPAHTGPQSGNVAVLVQDFSTTIFPKLIGGITEGLHGWGVPLQSGHILWLYSRSYQASEHHAPQILSLVEGCDSVVCQNDFIARLVIQTLTGAGVRIPQDIAVISFDKR